MGEIDSVHWKKFEAFLLKVGCTFKREKGDHRIYWKPGLKRPVVIPRDSRLPAFIIHNNLRLLGISRDEFLRVLNKPSHCHCRKFQVASVFRQDGNNEQYCFVRFLVL